MQLAEDGEVGSGGLYNNKTNESKPLLVADKPIGEWNSMRIVCKGSKVLVELNGEKLVDAATKRLESLIDYWLKNEGKAGNW